VRAFDPTTNVKRPEDFVYVNNLHYYNVGIGPEVRH